MNAEPSICVIYEPGCALHQFSAYKRTASRIHELVCADPLNSLSAEQADADIFFLVYASKPFLHETIPSLCDKRKNARILLFAQGRIEPGMFCEFSKYAANLAGVSHSKIAPEDLAYLVRHAHAGDGSFVQIIPPTWARDHAKAPDAATDPTLVLTDREMEVLLLIAEGATNRMIADVLFISENTAKTHVRRVLEKLQFNSRTKAALYAVNAGLAKNPS